MRASFCLPTAAIETNRRESLRSCGTGFQFCLASVCEQPVCYWHGHGVGLGRVVVSPQLGWRVLSCCCLFHAISFCTYPVSC